MSVIRAAFRAFGIALVCAWVMFFAGVFLSLVVMVVAAKVTDSQPDLALSYRVVGLTAGITAFILGFVGSLVYDIRQLNRTT